MAGAKPKGAGYKRVLDLARFVAAFGIVWDHARAPYADIGYTALALFLVLTSFLAMGSFERSGSDGFWLSRARRIAVPWLFWCVVYRIVYEVITDTPFTLLSEPFSVLIGPFIHLWFLPFVMVALVFIPTVSTSVTTVPRLTAACVALFALSLPLGLLHAKVGIAGWFVSDAVIPQPFPQWFYSFPLFLYGALAAVGHRLDVPWLPVLTAAAVSVALYVLVPEFASIQMILTALIFEALWRIKMSGTWPTTLAGYAFGIYLMHPIFMLVAFKLFGPDVDRILGAMIAFFGSWAATWVLQRIPGMSRFA